MLQRSGPCRAVLPCATLTYSFGHGQLLQPTMAAAQEDAGEGVS